MQSQVNTVQLMLLSVNDKINGADELIHGFYSNLDSINSQFNATELSIGAFQSATRISPRDFCPGLIERAE